MIRFRFNYWKSKTADRLWWWLAFHLPKRAIYYATMRLGSYATTGEYGATVVPELTFMDAVSRWSHDHGI